MHEFYVLGHFLKIELVKLPISKPLCSNLQLYWFAMSEHIKKAIKHQQKLVITQC